MPFIARREIQVATGDWVHKKKPDEPLMPVIMKGNKNAKLIFPGQQQVNNGDLVGKMGGNVKRSWTISNPPGTQGPRMNPNRRRNNLDPLANPDDNDPSPKIAPPVFLSVPPAPPPPTTAPPPIPGTENGSHVPHHLHAMTRRNMPMRTQSMSQADASARYFPPTAARGRMPMKHSPRAPRNLPHRDPDSDPDDDAENRRYRTLDPSSMTRSKSGGATSSGVINVGDVSGVYSSHSLERGMLRRRLPDVPPSSSATVQHVNSKSLPRPSKQQRQWNAMRREQSDSRSRERQETAEEKQKRSRSHGDELEDRRRQLPTIPQPVKPRSASSGTGVSPRQLREPTPDYDTSSVASFQPRKRRNSLEAVDISNKSPSFAETLTAKVKRHASAVTDMATAQRRRFEGSPRPIGRFKNIYRDLFNTSLACSLTLSFYFSTFCFLPLLRTSYFRLWPGVGRR